LLKEEKGSEGAGCGRDGYWGVSEKGEDGRGGERRAKSKSREGEGAESQNKTVADWRHS